MKKSKQILSLILTIVMVISIIPLAAVESKAITASEVKTKLDTFIKSYPSGGSWTSTFDGGSQCYGFAKLVVYNVFGKNSSGGYRSWTYAGVSTSGMNVVDSITSFSSDNVKSLLSKAKVGDVLQFNTTKQHSMIVYSVESDGVYIYDCNWDNNCGISLRKCSFGAWSGRNSTKLTLLRADNYSATTHTVDSSYSKNFTAYPKEKITASNIFDSDHIAISSTAWIGTSDLCTIHEVYTDGCCKISYPVDGGGSITAYSKISHFNVTHTHSYTTYVYYEAAHPHYKCYKCSCGAVKRNTNEPTEVSTCASCINPEAPVVTMNSTYKSGQIAITWNETANTTHYNLYLYNVAKDGTKTKYYNEFYVKSGVQYEFKQGSYCVVVQSTNSKYFTDDGSTWRYAETAHYFTVKNSLLVYYNTNGGTISSNDYKDNNGNVCWSGGSRLSHEWVYNEPQQYGLYNATTFGLSKCGYGFVGWSTEPNGTTIFDQDDATVLPTQLNPEIETANAEVTMYAVWQPNNYKISYNANGGSGTMTASTHTYDAAKNLSANTFTRTGYTFLGWSLSSSASTPTYADKQSVKNLTDVSGEEITLYAVWQKNAVTLSSVSIQNMPSKTTYNVGDAFSYSGLSLKATYSDGTTKNITTGFTVSSPDMSTTGEKTITVTYDGKITTFTITVNAVATNTSAIKLGSVTASYGQQITIPVTVEKASLSVLTVTINYDESRLELVSVDDIPFSMFEVNTDTAGKIKITAIDNSYVSAGIVANINFNVIAENDGTTEVTINVDEAFDSYDTAVALEIVNSTVTISSVLTGDANGDGKVSAIDARWILQATAGTRTLTEAQKAAADVNGDGKVSAIDARRILKIVAGLA